MLFLTDAQLRAEIEKCEYCSEKPCKEACPADCSPADFIMAARVGEAFDFKRAAMMILSHNPMGATCGAAAARDGSAGKQSAAPPTPRRKLRRVVGMITPS